MRTSIDQNKSVSLGSVTKPVKELVLNHGDDFDNFLIQDQHSKNTIAKLRVFVKFEPKGG